MDSTIGSLNPVNVFKHFDRILGIPRDSGKEDRVRDYVAAWATEHGFQFKIDAARNIFVRVPASPGMEEKPGTILQGHLDMVCVKGEKSAHNFEADPIPAYIDGEWIRSRGTTLGADNGVGLAQMLAVAEDKAPHGPLGLLFTVEEETGLDGASNLDPSLFLPGDKFLVNVDTEDAGEVYISCAGGGNVDLRFPVKREQIAAMLGVLITLSGLAGGHSGADIHFRRANAIKVMAQLLSELVVNNPWHNVGGVRLVQIDGGTKSNAIPFEARVLVGIPRDKLGELWSWIMDEQKVFAQRFAPTDQGVNLAIAAQANPALLITSAMDVRSTAGLIDLLLALPNGVITMSPDMPGLVETSDNVGIVSTKEEAVEIVCCPRSSKEGSLNELRSGIAQTAAAHSAEATLKPTYPGWPVDPNSRLVGIACEAWKEIAGGSSPAVKAVHAGLECGILMDRAKLAGIALDAVSIGATVKSPHSISECLQISTVGSSYLHLLGILTRIANL